MDQSQGKNFKSFLKEILPITDHRGWSWELWESILDKEWAMDLDLTMLLFKRPRKFEAIVDLLMMAEVDVQERIDHLLETDCVTLETEQYSLTEPCRKEVAAFYQVNKEMLDQYYSARGLE